MPNLAALHDIEATTIAIPDTWVVDTIALSENPQPKTYPKSLNIIARLNFGYGSTGTLPVSSEYNAFAQTVAMHVSGTLNCKRWIIANECNLSREWPNKEPIFPWDYAACYKLCRQAIHALPGHEKDEVLVAGSGPWNAELKYSDNPTGDWITYFSDVIELLNGELDGFSLHAYTHAYDTALVSSTARMASPFENRYYEFRTYRDYCNAVPEHLCHLPCYITEANGNGPWQAVGLMPAMLAEIDDWNLYGGLPLIQCVTFYRYPHYDDFYIEGRSDVIAEYQAAVAREYQSPVPVPPWPEPPQPTPPTPAPEPARDIDPRLLARGVNFIFALPPAGTGYWRMTKAEWLEDAANQVGPDHHILGQVLRDGQETAGVPLYVEWPSGDTIITSKADDPHASYNYDYAMSASLNEYSILVADGNPSDGAAGIGMGKDGNSHEHTSTWITWSWTISGDHTPPLPTPPGDVQAGYVTARAGLNVRSGPATSFPILGTLAYGSTVLWDGSVFDWMHLPQGWVSGEYVGAGEALGPAAASPGGKLIWPVRNAVITRRFGEEYDYYLTNFGSAGHNGIDFGLPIGDPIYATADGIVTMADEDKSGYGLFVRLSHPTLRLGSLYAHCDELLVRVGESVVQGQQIATVGSSGNATGPHCHWELCAQDESGYVDVSYGHSKGRANPEVLMWMLGTPSTYR